MADKPPSIRALKERFSGRDPTEQELASLQADSRVGVRNLAAALERRVARAEAWTARAAALSEPRRRLEATGFVAIGGIDEAGRGPLAGPVYTACVVLGPDWDLPGLDDSKKLSAAKRETLAVQIEAQALGFAVDSASSEEIDEQNILRATLASMRRAAGACTPQRPDYLLLDGLGLDTGLPYEAIEGGDGLVAEIAAASILAKVARDRLMVEADGLYPGYGFAAHKGYGTAAHMAAMERLGLCPIHRRSFAPVARHIRPTQDEYRRMLRRARSRNQLREVGRRIRRAGSALDADDLAALREVYRRCEAGLPW